MVKLFIGNLPREATEQEIRSLFEQYGKVLECDIIKNYGFVHIEDKTAAEDAIRNLHHYKLHGVNINVEASKNKSKASTKLHVGNISPTCTNQELRAKFEEYGPVIECDIVKDYAFVHMERAEDAVEAIRGLDNTEFQESGIRDGWSPEHSAAEPQLETISSPLLSSFILPRLALNSWAQAIFLPPASSRCVSPKRLAILFHFLIID
ncbi:RNA-binding protein 4B isoform X3 [Mus pahari]|uniref:RNA-binding protein 4B isoform X3 n=1 Tax=Mus pahari TaxID=10093 RepID=UPI001114D4D6|nr:RNA-binding protein 4B isoform X3 [Mus pahari]